MATDFRVLSLIPPMTQLNTPYPSTAYLTGFLRAQGVPAFQADLALALAGLSRFVLLRQGARVDPYRLTHRLLQRRREALRICGRAAAGAFDQRVERMAVRHRRPALRGRCGHKLVELGPHRLEGRQQRPEVARARRSTSSAIGEAP